LAIYEADSAVWNVINVIAKNQSFNLPLIRNICVLFTSKGDGDNPADRYIGLDDVLP